MSPASAQSCICVHNLIVALQATMHDWARLPIVKLEFSYGHSGGRPISYILTFYYCYRSLQIRFEAIPLVNFLAVIYCLEHPEEK